VHEFLLTAWKHSLLQALLGCHDYINDRLMAALAPAKQVVPKLPPRYEALFSKQTAYYRMHCIIIEGLYMQYLRPGISATSAMVNFCCTLLVMLQTFSLRYGQTVRYIQTLTYS